MDNAHIFCDLGKNIFMGAPNITFFCPLYSNINLNVIMMASYHL